MSLSIGIVGLPNVGKSTLFKALTKKSVDASNYPFCTIEPNVGIVPVPDFRLAQLANVYDSAKVVPAAVEFVDIAGLVSGAHKGEGLGNKFLSNIREVDAICQVVREFSDSEVSHVGGKIDPELDIQTINLELIYADLETIGRRLKESRPRAGSGDKQAREETAALEKAMSFLDQGRILSESGLSKKESQFLEDLHLLTLKPVLYVYNVNEDRLGNNPNRLEISAKLESEITDLDEDEAKAMLESLGLKQSGLDKLIVEAYQILGLLTFFTAGPKEAHAWTVRKGSTAPQAGGRIHSDFQEKFIKAEVADWHDIVEYKGEAGVKAAGKMHIEGREYVVRDGDVIYFHI